MHFHARSVDFYSVKHDESFILQLSCKLGHRAHREVFEKKKFSSWKCHRTILRLSGVVTRLHVHLTSRFAEDFIRIIGDVDPSFSWLIIHQFRLATSSANVIHLRRQNWRAVRISLQRCIRLVLNTLCSLRLVQNNWRAVDPSCGSPSVAQIATCRKDTTIDIAHNSANTLYFCSAYAAVFPLAAVHFKRIVSQHVYSHSAPLTHVLFCVFKERCSPNLSFLN